MNRISTNHGRYADLLFKLKISSLAECGPKQTISHVTFECPLREYGDDTSDALIE